ncbi:hypothetical protein HDU76_006474 [Blyttiomyces sp. JEL0837]|nr:hypothetical protein HDU76_006474 [Blyttiomyces sp. JEL0837]
MERERNAYGERLHALDSQVGEMRQRLVRCEQEHEGTSGQLASELATLRSENARLQKRGSELQSEINRLESNQASSSGIRERSELTRQESELQAVLRQVESALDQTRREEEEVEHLRSRDHLIVQKECMLAAQAAKVGEAYQSLDQLMNERESLRKSMQQKDTILVNIRQHVARRPTWNHKAESNLFNLLNQLRDDVDELRRSVNHVLEEDRDTFSKLTDEMQQIETKTSWISSEVKATKPRKPSATEKSQHHASSAEAETTNRGEVGTHEQKHELTLFGKKKRKARSVPKDLSEGAESRMIPYTGQDFVYSAEDGSDIAASTPRSSFHKIAEKRPAYYGMSLMYQSI